MEGRSKRARERRKARLLYEKKKKQQQQTKPKKTIVGRLSGLLAHFIMPLGLEHFLD